MIYGRTDFKKAFQFMSIRYIVGQILRKTDNDVSQLYNLCRSAMFQPMLTGAVVFSADVADSNVVAS